MEAHKDPLQDQSKQETSPNAPKETASESKTENSITLPRTEHEALLQKLKEFEELRDRMLRSAADFENAKKRLL